MHLSAKIVLLMKFTTQNENFPNAWSFRIKAWQTTIDRNQLGSRRFELRSCKILKTVLQFYIKLCNYLMAIKIGRNTYWTKNIQYSSYMCLNIKVNSIWNTRGWWHLNSVLWPKTLAFTCVDGCFSARHYLTVGLHRTHALHQQAPADHTYSAPHE